jgi:hypothetical protein
MADREKDIATLLEDVKTIKDILQNEDAPLPRMWMVAWTISPAIALAGLIQYFVPFYRDMDFDGRFFWLWLPGFCLIFPLAIAFLYREMSRTGKKFLGQSRVRHLMYARFVIPPAAVVLIWLLSRHPSYSLEGAVLLIVSIWMTAVEQLIPEAFRVLPVGFLMLGFVELVLGLTGPEVTLVNILLLSGSVAFVGDLFRRGHGGR